MAYGCFNNNTNNNPGREEKKGELPFVLHLVCLSTHLHPGLPKKLSWPRQGNPGTKATLEDTKRKWAKLS